MKEFYFNKFEHRRPYQPVVEKSFQTTIFQVSGILTLIFGGMYIYWRWTGSLNYEALPFALTLVIAETVSFVSIFFFIFDMWKNKDYKREPPPHYLSEIEKLDGIPDRPLLIDVFIATYNEEAELLRYTIRDAKAMDYPFEDVQVKIYVLDDGRRDGRNPAKENVKQLCAEEKVTYLSREDNIGFKAGNLKNGIAHSRGDLFVILDADARPYPHFLINTLGYFRRPKVAWVQTCQWFYDTTSAVPISTYLIKTFNIKKRFLQKVIKRLTFNFKTGEDIFGSDPRQFYQVIQRRRNNYNASFCCGAGSIHRREAVLGSALNHFAQQLGVKFEKIHKSHKPDEISRIRLAKKNLLAASDIVPFRFHASEDLYTSMVMHSDRKYRWESVMHPYVECKMLSPQDIDTFVKQRSRYAEGSVDIFFRDNPLFKSGLTWQQKLCYFNSLFSYFSCIWTLIFLFSPIWFFYSHIMPVSCDSADFLRYFVPFFVFIKIAEVSGSWGVSQKRGKQYHISLFWLNLQAIAKVVSGRKIKFNVTPKTKQDSRSLQYVWPHMTIILLTITGLFINILPTIHGEPNFVLAMTINGLWAIQNCYTLLVYVRAAFWDTETFGVSENDVVNDNDPTDKSIFSPLSPQTMPR